MAAEPRPPLRILFAEDDPDDVALIVRDIERAGWDVTWERIETPEAMAEALARTEWDIVLSDFSMPTFSAPAALALLQKTGLDIPFIIISGTIGEDVAVESLKAGAEDFLVKGRLVRLVPAIERGLREAADRRERRRAEEEVHERDRMLHHSQKMEAVGRLAGGVAHDFNNILTVIRGSAELLIEDAEDAVVRKDLQEIVRAADRAAAITRQLLAFSRRQPSRRAVLDLRAAIESARPVLERLLRDASTLGVHLPPGPVWVDADAAQIQQVILNLVINASDAMPQGGTVTVTLLEGAPDEVWIEVQDSGTGISPEMVHRVFDPFFTTKPEGQGTGLGLSIVAGIAEQHEGSVEVESEVGAGTRIRVRLPRAPAPPPAPREAGGAAERDLRGTFVLLVEDDERVRLFAARVLRDAGCDVVEAANASEAIARADRPRSFDLLFSDVVLPGIPGTELARRLFERGQVAAVLLTSGYPAEASIGDLPFLAKPFTGGELLAAVAAVLPPA